MRRVSDDRPRVYARGDSGNCYRLRDPGPELQAMYEEEKKRGDVRYSIPYSAEVAKGFLHLPWKSAREQAMDIFRYVVNEADRRGAENLSERERKSNCLACKRLDDDYENKYYAFYFMQVNADYTDSDAKHCLSLLECEQSLLYLNRAIKYDPEDAEAMWLLSRRYHRLHHIHREAGRADQAEAAKNLRDSYLEQAAEKGLPEAMQNRALLDLCSDDAARQKRGERALMELPPKLDAWRMRYLVAKARWLRGDKTPVGKLSAKRHQEISRFPTNVSGSDAMEQYFALELG